VLYLQKDSQFAKAYRDGVSKNLYWESVFEDSLNLIAKLPLISAYIYRHAYFNDDFIAPDPNLDMAGNFVRMMVFFIIFLLANNNFCINFK